MYRPEAKHSPLQVRDYPMHPNQPLTWYIIKTLAKVRQVNPETEADLDYQNESRL